MVLREPEETAGNRLRMGGKPDNLPGRSPPPTQNGLMAAKNGSQGPPRAHPRGRRGQRLGRQRKQTRDESMPVRSAQRSQRALHSSQTRAGLTGLDPWPQPGQTSGGWAERSRGGAGRGEGPGRRDSDIHRVAVPPALQAAGTAGVLAPAAVRAIVHDAAPTAHLVVMAEAAVALDGQGAAPEVAAPSQRRGGPALNRTGWTGPGRTGPGRTGPGRTGPGWTGGKGTTPGETLTHDGASEGRWKNPSTRPDGRDWENPGPAREDAGGTPCGKTGTDVPHGGGARAKKKP